jgi:hypothetical protein
LLESDWLTSGPDGISGIDENAARVAASLIWTDRIGDQD